MKSIIKILAITTAIMPAFMFSGCIQGKFDTPEVSEVPVGDTVTITRLWEIYDSLVAAGGGTYKFNEDHSVFGYITMSDKIGNIYKSAYLQGGADDDKAINLHLLSSGGIYEGDYVRVNLKGLVLGDYSGMIQLDSVHVDGISDKDMDMLVYHISLDKYTSNKQIREWLEVDRNTASKVIAALRKAGYIGDEHSNYIIPVYITTEVYFRLRGDLH